MKKTYEVYVLLKTRGRIMVDAENPSDAREKADQMYKDRKVRAMHIKNSKLNVYQVKEIQ